MNEFKINDKNKITSGFSTPDGYFSDFSLELNKKLKLTKTEVNVISINKKRWITSVAAVLIVALAATIYTKLVIENPEDSLEMENYISNHYFSWNFAFDENRWYLDFHSFSIFFLLHNCLKYFIY
jgi:hypothetical protein